MDRNVLLAQWDAFWSKGLYAAPISKALDGLSAAQAAWTPASGNHSVWQNVSHIVFWREYVLARVRGEKPLPEEEVEKRNWQAPASPTEAELDELRKALERSHQAVRAAIADGSLPADQAINVLAHDSYHLGQIMYVRALAGHKPIE